MWYRDDCHRKLVFFKNWTMDGCGSLSRWLGGGCPAMGNFYMNAYWTGAFRTHDLIRGMCCFVVMAGRFFGRKCPETVGHQTIRGFFDLDCHGLPCVFGLQGSLHASAI